MKIKLTLLLLLLCFIAKAQSISPDNRIVVIGQASIDVPADKIVFSVRLKSIDSVSIDNVYKKHKLSENKMIALLKELGVSDKNINYTLFSLDHTQDYDTKSWYYLGTQQVKFTIDSVQEYAKVQSRLIEEGFSEFDSNFTSSKIDTYTSQVLEKAITAAKVKAETMAKAADRKIKRIVKIADTDESDTMISDWHHGYIVSEMSLSAPPVGNSSLTSIAQSIPVSAQVKVVFELK